MIKYVYYNDELRCSVICEKNGDLVLQLQQRASGFLFNWWSSVYESIRITISPTPAPARKLPNPRVFDEGYSRRHEIWEKDTFDLKGRIQALFDDAMKWKRAAEEKADNGRKQFDRLTTLPRMRNPPPLPPKPSADPSIY